MRDLFMRSAALCLAVALLLAAGGSIATAATYGGTDLVLVAYQSHGREFLVNLGPVSAYAGSALPVPVTQFTAGDLSGVFGGTIPASLQIAVFGANGADGYNATGGPNSPATVGSAIGAASQIRSLGGYFAHLSHPVSGNANAAYNEFGEAWSYQQTLNSLFPGSLGGNVPFNVEATLAGSQIDVPFFS